MAALARAGRSYALLVDGTTLTIRPSGPGDYEAVKRLHEAMSPENLYFRFFSASRVSAEREARRVCLEGRPGTVALVGLLGDELVGVASYELVGDGAAAEVALAVADGMHRRGIATLLLEHLVSLARARGVKALTAEVLADNYAVLHVLTDSGLATRRRWDNGVVELSIPVPRVAALGEASAYLDAVAGRDRHADVASLEPLLNPRSVAVAGAGRRPGSIGRTILLNIRDAGFAGQVVRGQPGRRRHRGHPVHPVGRRAARGPRPGGGDGAGGACRRGGPGVRNPRRQVAGGGYRWPDHGAGIRAGGGDPARRHAAGGPGLLRHRGARDRAGGHTGRAPSSPRPHRPDRPVRRGRCGAARAVLPAGHRDLLVRRGRRQARCLKYRHAAVVGG